MDAAVHLEITVAVDLEITVVVDLSVAVDLEITLRSTCSTMHRDVLVRDSPTLLLCVQE